MSPRSRYDDDYDRPVRNQASYAWVWILLLVGVGGCVLLSCGVAGVVGVVFIIREDITNTTWRGNENLPGFGALTFEFKPKGQAIMRDAHGTVKGTWTKNGQNVNIRFSNCEYRGVINGDTMTGSAHGQQMMMGQVWQFTVTRN